MTEKPKTRKPAVRRASTRRPKTVRREPTHTEISERAYYIHLEQGGSGELENWLKAERELTAA
jgi:hypothetical protein